MARIHKRIGLARAFRKDPEPAEMLLWQALRNRALGGFKFRRQHPVCGRIVDFASPECGLIVELDGKAHERRRQQDATRTQALESAGWRVLRFSNNDVYDELDAVREAIYQACEVRAKGKPPSPPTPLPPPDKVSRRTTCLPAGGEGRRSLS
jgi:very-short-patch-repair endonuclease